MCKKGMLIIEKDYDIITSQLLLSIPLKYLSISILSLNQLFIYAKFQKFYLYMYKNINSNIFHWYTCIHYDSILINVGFKISRHCKSSLFYITTYTKSPTIVIKRQSSFLSWISWITQLHIHLFTNKYTITIDIMFCNNKSGQVEYHDYCWEQTDKIGVIHSF